MLVIGLTGGIGSGKSTVSALLAAKGAVVVDADAIVREVQQPGTPVFAAMVERFGPGIVAADGALDRAAVADIGVHRRRRRWPTSTPSSTPPSARRSPSGWRPWPRPTRSWSSTCRCWSSRSNGYPVAGLLVVDVDPEVAVQRLVGSRGMREDDVRARMARQATREERLARADRVVDNSGDLDDLARQVDDLWAWIGTLRAGVSAEPRPPTP